MVQFTDNMITVSQRDQELVSLITFVQKLRVRMRNEEAGGRRVKLKLGTFILVTFIMQHF